MDASKPPDSDILNQVSHPAVSPLALPALGESPLVRDNTKAAFTPEEAATLAYANELMGSSFFLRVAGVQLTQYGSTSDHEAAAARVGKGHRLSAQSDKGTPTRSGAISHRAPPRLFDLLRHLLVARLEVHVGGELPAWATWWQADEDYETALRTLRSAVKATGEPAGGWKMCTDAVIGYVDSFTGDGPVRFGDLAADIHGFAAIGADVRGCLEPQRQAILRQARADCGVHLPDNQFSDLGFAVSGGALALEMGEKALSGVVV